MFQTGLHIQYGFKYCEYNGVGILIFDPDFRSHGRTGFDPTEDTVFRAQKDYIYLFDELVHYYHHLEGTYQREPHWKGSSPRRNTAP